MCLSNSWLEIGLPLFTNYREEVFSETHMQLIETLCAKAPETIQLASYRCITLPEDLVVLDGYTVGCGRLSPNRPNLEPIGSGLSQLYLPSLPTKASAR